MGFRIFNMMLNMSYFPNIAKMLVLDKNLNFYGRSGRTKKAIVSKRLLKFAVLVWSASMLTLSYYEPPSGKEDCRF